MNKTAPNALYDVPVQSVDYKFQTKNQSKEVPEDTKERRNTSALGLLASTYGNSSDSEDDNVEPKATASGDETNSTNTMPGRKLQHNDFKEEAPVHVTNCDPEPGSERVGIKYRSPPTMNQELVSNGLGDKCSDPAIESQGGEKMRFSKAFARVENADIPFAPKSDEDSSRMHVFCLEHAIEVEQQLRQIGGVHVFLLCHPGRFRHIRK